MRKLNDGKRKSVIREKKNVSVRRIDMYASMHGKEQVIFLKKKNFMLRILDSIERNVVREEGLDYKCIEEKARELKKCLFSTNKSHDLSGQDVTKPEIALNGSDNENYKFYTVHKEVGGKIRNNWMLILKRDLVNFKDKSEITDSEDLAALDGMIGSIVMEGIYVEINFNDFFRNLANLFPNSITVVVNEDRTLDAGEAKNNKGRGRSRRNRRPMIGYKYFPAHGNTNFQKSLDKQRFSTIGVTEEDITEYNEESVNDPMQKYAIIVRTEQKENENIKREKVIGKFLPYMTRNILK